MVGESERGCGVVIARLCDYFVLCCGGGSGAGGWDEFEIGEINDARKRAFVRATGAHRGLCWLAARLQFTYSL